MVLTEDQKNLAMVITGKVSGAISIVSSLFIIRDIYKKWKTNQRRSRHHHHLPSTTLLVLSMSLGDVGSSFFASFLGSWMVPRDGGFPLAAGTQATCDAQAFVYGVFFSSSNMTNGIMALVYWLTVCREKPEKDFRGWKWQALMFGYPWLWGVGYSAAARYSVRPSEFPITWWCYGMFAKPGTTAAVISYVVVLAFFLLTCVLILLSMGALVRFVYRQEKKMDSFRFRRRGSSSRRTSSTGSIGAMNSTGSIPAMNSTGSSISREGTTQRNIESERSNNSAGSRIGSLFNTSANRTRANRAKTIQVAKQGFLYTAAFLVISIPTAMQGYLLNITSGGDYEKMGLPLGYYVFYAAIFPLQGFMNFFIYFRPKIVAVQKRDSTLSLRQSTMKALRVGGNVAASRRGATSGDSDNNNTMQPKVGSTEEPHHRKNSGLRRLSGVTFKDDVDLEALAKTASIEMETSKADGSKCEVVADTQDSFAENEA